jgi:hypothetical protein
VRFFRLSIFPLLRLSLSISEFLANLLLAIFAFFSKAILSLFGAVIAQFGRQFDENIITVIAELNFLGQFVELKYFIAIQSLSALRIDESNVNAL